MALEYLRVAGAIFKLNIVIMSDTGESQERPTFAYNSRQQQALKELEEQLSKLNEKLNPYIGRLGPLSQEEPEDIDTDQLTQFEQEQHKTLRDIEELTKRVTRLIGTLQL